MKIGDVDLGYKPLLLAPMEDVTDSPFRKLCKKYGADLMYTEFVAADALVRTIPSTMRKLTIADEERPVGIQIYGHEIEPMVEAARIAEQAAPELIDINFGCPVKKIAHRGAGSGMLRDIPKMVRMTAEIVKAVKLPVTVKTRLGWDENTKYIVDIAERLQDTGIKALTIHGRTRAQFYTGEADWTLIGEVKNNPRMTIPIIGNGDIVSPQKAKDYFDRYGVDAVMIGRASIGRPWIFREMKHYLQTGELLPPPTMAEHVAMVKEQLSQSVQWLDTFRGILHMRRHLAVTFKGLPHFREMKTKLLQCNDYDMLMALLDQLAEQYHDYCSSFDA
ncbi:MAG: tRNA dihydrouridine synthase DusB [Breznakibacter sp.]